MERGIDEKGLRRLQWWFVAHVGCDQTGPQRRVVVVKKKGAVFERWGVRVSKGHSIQ